MAELDLIVAGGGPAGMMAGVLFARAGCRVQVLEKHPDFLHDFRGDTVHPSTMEVLDDLGILDRFLERPHTNIPRADLRLAGRTWKIADFSRLKTVAPFIALVPQWEFLDFLRQEGRSYPGFDLAMNSKVAGLFEEQGRIAGVRLADGREVRARLTIAADGRTSFARDLLPVKALAAPMDILWFSIPKRKSLHGELRFSMCGGAIVVLMDRDTYWQCAFVIPKGQGEQRIANGIEPIRETLREAAPDLDLRDLKDTSGLNLLSVSLDRLTRWHVPGLLAIGDAAHAMSPIGGVGISLAIQDAVAAANILAGPLAQGECVEHLLGKVRDRRMPPTRVIQRVQELIQDRIIWPVLSSDRIERIPLIVRLFDALPALRGIPGHLMGLGVRRERVRPSPRAARTGHRPTRHSHSAPPELARAPANS
jgi:2-polyprenyl-6-methoxyphenol hydroxylase-like FAD-dependent oxidoreductase